MGGSTKQALLQALSAAEGAYISGQQLAEALGVSRAAVHKAAQALSAQGYALDSAPRRGYRLAGGDPFCAEAVGPYPAPIHIYDTLQSSNLTAKQLALGGAPHGTLVLTAHQQAGRGRLGRRFESPAGKGVYLSLILRPTLSAADAQSATISAAVAVARAVKALCGLELGIKWVNDLYYQGRKVCGILTEAGTDMESGQLEWLVVGIGLNLTTSPADWPEELARTAGSLYTAAASGETACHYAQCSDCCCDLCHLFHNRYSISGHHGVPSPVRCEPCFAFFILVPMNNVIIPSLCKVCYRSNVKSGLNVNSSACAFVNSGNITQFRCFSDC